MGFVSASDYERILAIVAEASYGTPNEPLPGYVLEMIRAFVGCDVAGFFDGAPDDRVGRRVWATPVGDRWTADERAVVDRCRAELPLQPTPTTLGRAVRISDTMPQAVYRNTEIYRLAGRRHRIEYSMDYWGCDGGGHLRGLTFDDSVRDFSDRTRDSVEVLGRHLQTVLARHDPGAASRTTSGLTVREAQILALAISPHTVRKHLENAFASIGVHSRAEAVLQTYGGPPAT